MIRKQTKAQVMAIMLASSLVISDAKVMYDNYSLKATLNNKSAQYQQIQKDMDKLKQQQQQILKENQNVEAKNAELQNYIDVNKQTLQGAEVLKKQIDEVQKENNALKLYMNSKGISYSRGGNPNEISYNPKVKVRKITVELSMYVRTGNKTASGTTPHWGQIAAPPEVPMGSSLIVSGVRGLETQVFTVTDRGGYIKKVGDVYRIDIYTDNSEAYASTFGRLRNIEAYLIEEDQ